MRPRPNAKVLRDAAGPEGGPSADTTSLRRCSSKVEPETRPASLSGLPGFAAFPSLSHVGAIM